jgi:hypothetical protein
MSTALNRFIHLRYPTFWGGAGIAAILRKSGMALRAIPDFLASLRDKRDSAAGFYQRLSPLRHPGIEVQPTREIPDRAVGKRNLLHILADQAVAGRVLRRI